MSGLLRPEYSLDTSALIQAWNQLYPIDINPAFWDWLSEQLNQGRVIAHVEVLREIERNDDELYAWVKKHKQSFVELEQPAYEVLRDILARFGTLMNLRTNRSGADPFVIALALSTETKLITEETASNSSKAPRIPDVCKAYESTPLNLVELHRAEGIVYSRG